VAAVVAIVICHLLWLESRHHRQYVTITHNGRAIQAIVDLPQVNSKASVVILIHEIYGLSDWAKEMADELADEGFSGRTDVTAINAPV